MTPPSTPRIQLARPPLGENQRQTLNKGSLAFSLVEVTMALAITGFAMVSLIGLLSVGLDQSRRNIEVSVQGQIMDWTRGQAKAALESDNLPSVTAGNPYYFDGDGLALDGADASNAGRRVFSATILPTTKQLPGSTQSVWGVEIVIKAPARNNQLLGSHAFWFGR
jgi:uncharacterized protein (TIGR02598 family)